MLQIFELDQLVLWIEFYQEIYDDFPKECKFKYKRGREPDVLAFLILGEEEQKLVRH